MHSLIPAYRELHAAGKFPGFSVERYVPQIAGLVRHTAAKSILDYGCGEGRQYTDRRWHDAWGIMPSLYDPAVLGFDVLPLGKFDGVICSDVLEHVPEDELDGVLAELRGYAKLWCFISVCCRPAKPNKNLPGGGQNAHVTIRRPEWWRQRLSERWGLPMPTFILEFTP